MKKKSTSKFIGQNQTTGLSTEELFWQKVDKKGNDECWEWIGCRHHQWKYGSFSVNKKTMAAHRYSWILHNGEIPKGLLVCHHCDNPPCVNPKHLFLGTVADNNLDKKLKGRSADVSGEKNPKAKLTNQDVIEIKKLYGSGISGAELGRRYNVAGENIYDIWNGRKWKSVQI